MAKSTRKTLLLAKIQTAPGADPIPTGAADAMLVRNLTPTPLSAEFVDRDLLRPYMGNAGQIATTQYSQLEFEVELAGAGEAGKSPAWGACLRACGFSETVAEGIDVRYAPVSQNFEQIGLHYYLDGLFHKILDARGTVSVDMTAKGIPVLKFRFIGAYQPIKDSAMPVDVNFDAFMIPKAVNKQNVPSWSLGEYTGCLQTLSIDMANELVWRALINCEGAEITNRKPTGKISLELPPIAQLNWPAMVLSGQGAPLTITHGAEAGNVVQLNVKDAQLTNPAYSDLDGVAMLDLDMNVNPGQTGNDELEIVVR
jgi:hypothetical protein